MLEKGKEKEKKESRKKKAIRQSKENLWDAIGYEGGVRRETKMLTIQFNTHTCIREIILEQYKYP